MARLSKSDTKNILYIFLVAVLIGAFVLVLPGSKPNPPGSTIEAQVLAELATHNEIKPYVDGEKTVVYLSEAELADRRGKQPAIYDGVSANTYEVDYKGAESGLLVIYDFESKEILKMFSVQNFVI